MQLQVGPVILELLKGADLPKTQPKQKRITFDHKLKTAPTDIINMSQKTE